MGEPRKGEHRPIQTSAVIVLNGSKRPITRPPSPPTPSVTPADGAAPAFTEPSEPFQLAGQRISYRSTASHTTPRSGLDTADQQQHAADDDDIHKDERLREGLHVLRTEALALAHLARLYETEPLARDSFHRAVAAVTRTTSNGGKLVLIGVGKSGLIARKLAATFQSLAVRAAFLHPTEALHGDLGLVDPAVDALLLVTYSGATPELLALLPHLDQSMPAIVITSAHSTCEIVRQRPGVVVVPAPVHEPERVSFGVSAPTTSTTAALAVGDALAVTAARELQPDLAAAFARNHPGGAIGLAAAASASSSPTPTPPASSSPPLKKVLLVPPPAITLRHIAVRWDAIADCPLLRADSPAASLLRAAYASKKGWVRVGEAVTAPRRLRALCDEDLLEPLGSLPGLLVSCHDMLAMSADTTVRQARDILLRGTLSDSGGAVAGGSSVGGLGEEEEEDGEAEGAVIAVTENGRICGVLEAAQVLEHQD
ncbi:sugar isomerase, KpsF/GutQ [Cordyceps fumosorosea ARSEF 2679]|uniref:Sugar isomerase, KpsF/GutQ n=1 Tax=Cordyceps fumosorosea (strain ARSEF 2679) TaxID=1081104 RepID=A0A167NDE3_CORFA|nr:sugar isomerase, KpsF/GutQ [Cordyceps fumosorosea ARSEF 2679]OAA55427.1 sugar isomerase, KpsF/GutQ [Cordyceps fumosorosea ARSEF 2679]